MPKLTCCFTGHRLLPKDRLDEITLRLSRQVDEMIVQGVSRFISGGALGFDQLAALVVLSKREDEHKPIELVIAQPCRTQSEKWTARQRSVYESILARADEVVCLSETYYNGCMQMRNRWMVEHSDHVIACLARLRGGTAQTVACAVKNGLPVWNVWP